ncbi:MAG: GNAT family N-acetyltransferase [Verrucomicrobiales bacterium]
MDNRASIRHAGTMANDAYELFVPSERDHDELARLIHHSTNTWYERNRGYRIFTCTPEDCRIFPDFYGELDPGQAIALRCRKDRLIAASCFYHPRITHASLGIMNVHPEHAGRGLASRLLGEITARAEGARLPLRLVSSAMNLDSYSLYTRHGFVPFAIYQDMLLRVPEEGLPPAAQELPRVRPAGTKDIAAMVDLEMEIAGIRRPGDIARFVEDTSGWWRVFVVENPDGSLDGYLASIDHPASRIIGPGVAHGDATAVALARAQLDHFRGLQPLILLPADRPALSRALHDLGARNCEIHFAQARGPVPKPTGIVFPTFLPESG